MKIVVRHHAAVAQMAGSSALYEWNSLVLRRSSDDKATNGGA